MSIWKWLMWRLTHDDDNQLLWDRIGPKSSLQSSSRFDSPFEKAKNSFDFKFDQSDFSWGELQMNPKGFRPNYFLAAFDKPWEKFKVPFDQLNCDIEAKEFIHRFYWLNSEKLMKDSALNHQQIIKQWISESSHKPEVCGAYMTSERLANWGLRIVRAVPDLAFKKEIQASVKIQAQTILDSLECRGVVGNHLFNNFRGLFWAGILLQDKMICKTALGFADTSLNLILTAEFILREDSVHYHHLVTRNYFEMLWLAQKIGFKSMEIDLSNHFKRLDKMLDFCDYFPIQHLVGDISPDSPPTDLIGWVEFARFSLAQTKPRTKKIQTTLAKNWASLFEAEIEIYTPSLESQKIYSNWAVKKSENWKLIVHHNPQGHPFLPGHGHCDSGSFELWFRNQPFILDPARATYESSEAVLPENHNGVLINDQSDFVRKSYMGPKFIESLHQQSRLVDCPNGLKLEKSFGQQTNLSRLIELETHGAKITDLIQGSGLHNVKKIFHSRTSDNLEIIWPSLGRVTQESCSIANAYGQTTAGIKWIWEADLQLPYKDEILIKAKETIE